jgi:hypothetical protein
MTCAVGCLLGFDWRFQRENIARSTAAQVNTPGARVWKPLRTLKVYRTGPLYSTKAQGFYDPGRHSIYGITSIPLASGLPADPYEYTTLMRPVESGKIENC